MAGMQATSNYKRQTALMFASSKGMASVVEKLLAAGARADLRNEDGKNALEVAEARLKEAQDEQEGEKIKAVIAVFAKIKADLGE
jgi:hypothetical protein